MSLVDKLATAVLIGLIAAVVPAGFKQWSQTGAYPADYARQFVIAALLILILWQKKDRSER